MKQFRYRPPSAGRTLIRNSDDREDSLESEIDDKESLKKEVKKLKTYISEIIRHYFA